MGGKYDSFIQIPVIPPKYVAGGLYLQVRARQAGMEVQSKYSCENGAAYAKEG
jgi:hypothetical protein